MSGETEDQVSGWTTDTLHAHVHQRFNDMQKLLDERYETQTKALDAAFKAAEAAVGTALNSAEKAVAKAETAAEKRFESVNEFRAQLSDQNASFITRVEYDAKLENLTTQIDDLKRHSDQAEGRSDGMGALYGWIIAAVGLVVSVIVMMNVIT